jgi:hypothetical protein
MRLGFRKDTPQLERRFHEIRVSSGGSLSTVPDSVINDMHTLDSKSSALLQFISVVLAALTFSIGLVNERLEFASYIKAGLIVFIAAFALAAWVNFRCLYAMGPPFNMNFKDAAGYEQEMITELTVRRASYFASLQITRIAFLLLVPFIAIWIGMVAREVF